LRARIIFAATAETHVAVRRYGPFTRGGEVLRRGDEQMVEFKRADTAEWRRRRWRWR
jgi:hypothetical protein